LPPAAKSTIVSSTPVITEVRFLRPGHCGFEHVLPRTPQRNRSELSELIVNKTRRNRSSQHENQQLRKRSLRSGRWLIGSGLFMRRSWGAGLIERLQQYDVAFA
jgi:hypothetical protein